MTEWASQCRSVQYCSLASRAKTGRFWRRKIAEHFMKQEWHLRLVAEKNVITSVVNVQSSEELSLKTGIANVTIYLLAVPCTYKGKVNLTHGHEDCEKELWNAGMDAFNWQFMEHSSKWTVL